jgi:hypothetical protein
MRPSSRQTEPGHSEAKSDMHVIGVFFPLTEMAQ